MGYDPRNPEYILLECYYCDFGTVFKPEYEQHVIQEHPGKPAYPSVIELKAMNIEPKGKSWENPKVEPVISNFIERETKKEIRANKRNKKKSYQKAFEEEDKNNEY